MNWVLCDPPKHKLGCAQQHPIIKWKWYIWDLVQQALNTQVDDMKKWPKHPWSPFLLYNIYYLLSPTLYLWHHEEFHRISCERKRRLIPGYRWFFMICKQYPECTALVLQLLLGIPLKDSSEEKSCQPAELWAVHFAWEEKRPDVLLHTEWWVVANGLAV